MGVIETQRPGGGMTARKTDEGITNPIAAWVDATKNERLLIFFLGFRSGMKIDSKVKIAFLFYK